MHGTIINRAEVIEVFSNDPVISSLLKKFGIPEESLEMDVFNALIRSIVSQQLSVTSAKAIYGKFTGLFEGGISMAKLLKIDIETLRSAGLSGQKASYVRNVAVFFNENGLLDYDWQNSSDEEIIDLLTQIKGVGVWTVQMLLMFSLNRIDVFPSGDLGIKLGMIDLYNIKSEGRELIREMEEIADKWKPFRSIGSKLIWMGKDEK